jgi:hypothetical protein
MGRVIRVGGLVYLLCAGCATAPPLDNPILTGGQPTAIENPVLVAPGMPTAPVYQEVFEKCIGILSDYFDDLYPPNPYAGVIVSRPRVAPGYEQFWKPGNPDPRARLLATLQTIRQTATIRITPGEHGGFLVYVEVDRELEDIPRPTLVTLGTPIFEETPTVSRPFDVVNQDLTTDPTSTWFKVGRDYALEQVILDRIRRGH